MERKLYAEDYVFLLKGAYEGKEIYCNDIGRVLTWEEIAEDFMTYSYGEYSIFDYVNHNLLGQNSNCELRIKK